MIPKTIHYYWFGRGEMPELAQKCLASRMKCRFRKQTEI